MYHVLIRIAGYVVVFIIMLTYLSTKLGRAGAYMMSIGASTDQVDEFYASMNPMTFKVCNRNGWLFGIPLGIIIAFIVL